MMMRLLLFILAFFGLGVQLPAAQADALSEDFKARIDAALAAGNTDQMSAAVGRLFYRESLDKWAENLAGRTADRLVKMQGRDISFGPLPADKKFLHVVNGYEYRPNLQPLGYVIFTDPAAVAGNNTKVPYGLHPRERRYYFPLTVRRLVNPAAPADKQLQMLIIGIANPPATFEGWCDIALSNNTIKRVTLGDQNVGNQTLVMRGQSIERCHVTNTSGRGALTLRLYEDGKPIFERRIASPKRTITYRRS
jgi:hypothetical protein